MLSQLEEQLLLKGGLIIYQVFSFCVIYFHSWKWSWSWSLFTSEGKGEWGWCNVLYWSVVVRREINLKAKLTIYWSIFIPFLKCGHELWRKAICHLPLHSLGYYPKGGCTQHLKHRIKSLVIQEGLRVQSLLLHIQRRQLKSPGYLIRIPPGRSFLGMFYQEETLRKIHNMLERWYLLAGTETTVYLSWLGRRTCGLLCICCHPHDPKSSRKNGWMSDIPSLGWRQDEELSHLGIGV